PDGISGRMQMFLFDLTTPNRDGDLDAEVFGHEYFHGVSNRLTGGPADAKALDALQSGGTGEGWGDFSAPFLTTKPTAPATTARPVGNYVLGLPPNGPGIRRRPYDTDMNVDDETIDWFNATNPHFSQEAHDVGEIWTSTLWDMNWLFI